MTPPSYEVRPWNSPSRWFRTLRSWRIIATTHKGHGWFLHQRCDRNNEFRHVYKKHSTRPNCCFRIDSNWDKWDIFINSSWLYECKTHRAYCGSIQPTLGIPGSSFNLDKNGRLLRYLPIDSSVWILVPRSMCPIILHLAHYITFTGSREERRVYGTLWSECSWLNMKTYVYRTNRHCQDCCGMRTKFKHQR